MSRVQHRDFECDVYHTDGIDAYPPTARIYVATTVAFLVYTDGSVRQLSTGENASVHDIVSESDPIEQDTLTLYYFDNSFYTTHEDEVSVNIGEYYLVDGETVFTPVSKTNRVAEHPPIEEIAEDEFSPDHEDIYVVERRNPFGRFRYRANHVRRFIKSDRVEKLVPVAPA